MLNNRGATVPVMVNCMSAVSASDKARMVKIYHHIFFAASYIEIEAFSLLLPLEVAIRVAERASLARKSRAGLLPPENNNTSIERRKEGAMRR